MVEKEESIRIESTSRSTRSVVAGSNNGGGSAASDSSPPPTTTKIAERLTLAVEVAVIDKNMSPGLVPLAQHYEKLKKHLRSLLSSAKTYQQHSIQIQKSRNEVSLQLLLLLLLLLEEQASEQAIVLEGHDGRLGVNHFIIISGIHLPWLSHPFFLLFRLTIL